MRMGHEGMKGWRWILELCDVGSYVREGGCNSLFEPNSPPPPFSPLSLSVHLTRLTITRMQKATHQANATMRKRTLSLLQPLPSSPPRFPLPLPLPPFLPLLLPRHSLPLLRCSEHRIPSSLIIPHRIPHRSLHPRRRTRPRRSEHNSPPSSPSRSFPESLSGILAQFQPDEIIIVHSLLLHLVDFQSTNRGMESCGTLGTSDWCDGGE